MASISPECLEHARRVCSLYKQAIRLLEGYYHNRAVLRYECAQMRNRFDCERCEPDFDRAKALVCEGERKLFKMQHPVPKKFPNSPGGVAFEREVIPPDWVLDYWHPLEKAQFPDYFERREKRKQEFVEWWNSKYGEPTEPPSCP